MPFSILLANLSSLSNAFLLIWSSVGWISEREGANEKWKEAKSVTSPWHCGHGRFSFLCFRINTIFTLLMFNEIMHFRHTDTLLSKWSKLLNVLHSSFIVNVFFSCVCFGFFAVAKVLLFDNWQLRQFFFQHIHSSVRRGRRSLLVVVDHLSFQFMKLNGCQHENDNSRSSLTSMYKYYS